VIECEQLTRRFRADAGVVTALDDVTLQVGPGEFVVIRGASGSGKTTLLMAVGGMDRPSSGRVRVAGRDVYALSPRERATFRADNIGFVFQMFHLVPYLNVTENVMLAAGPAAEPGDRARADELLEQLGMSDRRRHRPAQLSAGERQRLAIARALLNRPKVILADEPTGNLDPENAAEVFDALAGFHRDGGTVLVVTHGTTADAFADRIVHLDQGRVVGSDAATESAATS
jgi:ABC-type lipoprotein export system ATPase subunit